MTALRTLVRVFGWYLIASAIIGFLFVDWSFLTDYTYSHYSQIAFLFRLTPIPTLIDCNGLNCEAGGVLLFVLVILGLAATGIAIEIVGRTK